MTKRSKLSRNLAKVVRDAISEEVDTFDIHKWKLACRGFGPIHYQTSTRKQWLKKNDYRLEGAREIVDFVDKWVTHFRNMKKFEKYTVSSIRQGVILVIRSAQQRIKAEMGILNSVKLNGFKTLIKWADNPKELEKGPYKGRKAIP